MPVIEPIEMVLPAGDEPVMESDGICQTSLSASDRPVSAIVKFFTSLKKLTIEFCYPAGMREPREPVRANHVQVFVGEYSGRVLGLELDCTSAVDDATLARNITRELTAALAELQRRSTSSVGIRMNRVAVTRDLSLNSGSVPPPWIVETIQRAHKKHPVRR